MIVEKTGRVDERVSMHDAVTRELSVFEPGYHAKHTTLLGERKVGLKTHQVVARAMHILSPQLQRRPRPSLCSRVGQTNGLERPEPRGVMTCTRDLLNRLACLEKILRLKKTSLSRAQRPKAPR